MSLTVDIKVDTVDDLLGIVDPHNGAGFKLKCLLALRDRVIEETGLSVGCSARLRTTIEVQRSSGWWPFRHSLRRGCVGTITEISFSSRTGRMLCAWVPAREWTTSSFPRRGRAEHWASRPGRSSFLIHADELEAL